MLTYDTLSFVYNSSSRHISKKEKGQMVFFTLCFNLFLSLVLLAKDLRVSFKNK